MMNNMKMKDIKPKDWTEELEYKYQLAEALLESMGTKLNVIDVILGNMTEEQIDELLQ